MKTQKIIIIIAFLVGSLGLFAQEPGAPPPPPANHGAEGNQGPSDAPIDGGLGILLVLGAAYGGKRLYVLRKEQMEK